MRNISSFKIITEKGQSEEFGEEFQFDFAVYAPLIEDYLRLKFIWFKFSQIKRQT